MINANAEEIRDALRQVLGSRMDDMSPADTMRVLDAIDTRSWWRATLADMLLGEVGMEAERQDDQFLADVTRDAVRATMVVTKALD